MSMMKKTLAFVLMAGFLAVTTQTQANLVLGSGDIWVNADTGNTALADGSGDPWQEPYPGYPGNQDGLWNYRTGFGYDAAGVLGGAIYEAQNNSYGQLKTTAGGLVDGQEYAVYVVYSSKHVGEDWNVTADFNPISLGTSNVVASGTTYGAADLTVAGVNIVAGENIDDNGGGILQFRGLVGNVTGTGAGTLDVYIDDIGDNINSNYRAWYDGIYLEAIPEPATIGLIGIFGGGLLFVRRRYRR